MRFPNRIGASGAYRLPRSSDGTSTHPRRFLPGPFGTIRVFHALPILVTVAPRTAITGVREAGREGKWPEGVTGRAGEADSGHIEMSFPYFINKTAPVSGVQSLLDYDVTLIGEIHNGTPTMYIKVVVPVTSLCPCSKKISDRGAHNQRSHVTVQVRTNGFVWIEEIIDLVEKEASCELYGLLKRPDEKYVTEHAYDNPKFVEDMVRDVAGRLNDEERFSAYIVESENFESIHNHSAYALIERDKLAD